MSEQLDCASAQLDRQDPKKQSYLVLSEIKRSSIGGMGDAEFRFEFLCMNAQGEICIVSEDYIQYNGNPQGISLIDEGNLVHWSIRHASPDAAFRSLAEGAHLRMDARDLRQPPFAPKLHGGLTRKEL